MRKRRIYPGALKADIVLELLRGRKTLLELAHLHEIHPNQIKNWKSSFLKQATHFFEDKRTVKK